MGGLDPVVQSVRGGNVRRRPAPTMVLISSTSVSAPFLGCLATGFEASVGGTASLPGSPITRTGAALNRSPGGCLSGNYRPPPWPTEEAVTISGMANVSCGKRSYYRPSCRANRQYSFVLCCFNIFIHTLATYVDGDRWRIAA
jgi:hypothetical protein